MDPESVGGRPKEVDLEGGVGGVEVVDIAGVDSVEGGSCSLCSALVP